MVFGQKTDRKHMKRCLEAYFTLNLALSTILYENVLTFDNKKWTELKIDFLRLTNSFLDLQMAQKDESFMIQNLPIEVLNSSEFLNQLNAFCSSFTYQAKYLYNFMKVFEILILFIWASRQNDRNLHLASLIDFLKFFCGRSASEYESWQYLEENFSTIKTKISFLGIGTNHALEQKKNMMKVAGGVIGLTQNQAASNPFCLSAPILSSLTLQFLEKNNVDVNNFKGHLLKEFIKMLIN